MSTHHAKVTWSGFSHPDVFPEPRRPMFQHAREVSSVGFLELPHIAVPRAL